MDGARLVYAGSALHACEQTFVWNVMTGKQTRGSAPSSRWCGYGALEGLAVNRARIAWKLTSCGNCECTDVLLSSTSAASRARTVATADRLAGDCDYPDRTKGGWIEGIVGSGSVMAVSRWLQDTNGTITGAGLDVFEAGGFRRIVTGPQGIVAWAVDAGRIAVLRPVAPLDRSGGLYRYEGSSIGVYSSSGRLLRTITPTSARDVALRGDWLLVLTDAPTIDAYSVSTGRRLHSWPVRKGAQQLDAYGGVAVYANPGVNGNYFVHAVRLSTGRDVVLARALGWPNLRLLAIEEPGLVYEQDFHHLVFLPLARVLAAVGAPAAA